jgi:thiamine biosynthesis protein ThiS
MAKLKKIEIKVNGRVKFISDKYKMSDLLKNLKIPMKKVAIELNQEIIDKKNIHRINLKKNDKIEIVHFIGGG